MPPPLDLLRALDPAVAYAGALGFLAVAAGVRPAQRAASRRRRPASRHPRPPPTTTATPTGSPMRDARRLFPGPDPGFGGIVVGEAYRVDQDRGARAAPSTRPTKRSWGQGGTAPLLVDPCRTGSTHALVLAGSGGFKTTAVGVPTLLAWTGAAVVLDPSREIGPMVPDLRGASWATGSSPSIRPTPASGAFNALDWIDPASPLAETNVEAVVDLALRRGPRRRSPSGAEFFRDSGKGLIACLLADMLWDPDLAAGAQDPASSCAACWSRRRPRCASASGASMPAPPARSPATSPARSWASSPRPSPASTPTPSKDTRWLSTAAYADLVSATASAPRDLADGRLTVFVQVPLRRCRATPGARPGDRRRPA